MSTTITRQEQVPSFTEEETQRIQQLRIHYVANWFESDTRPDDLLLDRDQRSIWELTVNLNVLVPDRDAKGHYTGEPTQPQYTY